MKHAASKSTVPTAFATTALNRARTPARTPPTLARATLMIVTELQTTASGLVSVHPQAPALTRFCTAVPSHRLTLRFRRGGRTPNAPAHHLPSRPPPPATGC